jgi:hypothetical protein
MAKGQGNSVARRIGGVALLLVGVALMGWGTHYLTESGTCSSTGYASFGPVPKCGGGEFFYITATFFVGPFVTLVGWGFAKVWAGTLWPAVCVGLGVALVTIHADSNANPGAKSFGLVAGASFFALAVLSMVITTRKRIRARNAPAGPPGGPGSPMMPSPFSMPPVQRIPADAPVFAELPLAAQPPRAASGPRPDPLDKIAKLAALRDSGALTEAEFEREKAKLLAQM